MTDQIITNGAELKLTSEMREIDNTYSDLNSGGCIFVAKWIGEAFIKKGVNVSYLILDNWGGDLTDMRADFKKYANVESLEDLSERMLQVSHVLPFIDKKFYLDSRGVAKSHKASSWSHYHKMGYITHDTIERWCNDRYYEWNPLFMHKHGHELRWIEKDIKKLIKSLHI